MKSILRESLKGEGIKFIGLFAIMLLQILLSLIPSMIMQAYIDEIGMRTVEVLFAFAIVYFLTNLLLKGVGLLVIYVSKSIGWVCFNQVRSQTIRQMMGYDQSFYNENSSGTLLEYFERDIGTLQEFFSGKFLEMILNVGTILGMLIVFSIKNIGMGLLFLAYVVFSFLLIYMVLQHDKESLGENMAIKTFNIGKYSEWLVAAKDICLCGGLRFVLKKMDAMDMEYRQSEVRAQSYLYRIWSMTLFLTCVVAAVSLAGGVLLYVKGLVTVGEVYLFYSYALMLKIPFENFQSQLQVCLKAKTAYERMSQILSYDSEVMDGIMELDVGPLGIRFEHVFYTYKNSMKYALEDISFEVMPREIIGMSGASGSGKSTVCKILCKMIEPTGGFVYLNGIRLSEIGIDSLRKRVAYVSTEAFIYQGTIRDNLVLFDREIPNEVIISRLDEYGMLLYFQEMGDLFLDMDSKDKTLSYGQKQMISLCRVLFVKCGLLILDEASSKVDASIKKSFLEVLRKLSTVCTVLIVSHDIEMLGMCAKVITISDGRMSGAGGCC